MGQFKNAGREWRPQGQPEEVKVHDFVDKELGKVTPYGVYALSQNEGWVSVGIDRDTAQFAVQAISRWWKKMGAARYPQAKQLLITADGGGSNSSRCRLWKVALQELARSTVGESRSGYQIDWQHENRRRVENTRQVGPRQLSDRHQSQQLSARRIEY